MEVYKINICMFNCGNIKIVHGFNMMEKFGSINRESYCVQTVGGYLYFMGGFIFCFHHLLLNFLSFFLEKSELCRSRESRYYPMKET